MKKFPAALLSVALALAGAAALAQTFPRVRGTITAVDGNMLSVRSREGRDLKIEIAPDTAVTYMKKLSLADVKPGTPLGTSAVKGPDGRLVARELHLFPADRPVPNEGHRPWDLEPGSTMTNGRTTGVVESKSGREITLSYKDGAQRVIVPENTPVVMSAKGDRSLLVPGVYAFIAVTSGADGKLTATRVQVTKDGVRPPQ